MKESDKVIGEIRQELGSRRVKDLQSWRGMIAAGDELCCGAAQKEGFRICADYLIGRLMKMPVDMAVLQVMEWNATREEMG